VARLDGFAIRLRGLAVRAGVDLGGVTEALVEAKRRGCANIGPIAAREARRWGSTGFCRRYLSTSSL